METGMSRAWLMTLQMMAGSSTGVVYRYWGLEVSEVAVFLTVGRVTAGAAIVVLDSVAGPAALGRPCPT
jgi:hypothetical protein